MELEEIRQISLVGFLENLGHMPVSRKGNDVWFRSPFRNERTASFKVDTQRNVWFDFGLGKGGDIFHLAGELTGSTGFHWKQLEFLFRGNPASFPSGLYRNVRRYPAFPDSRT